MAAKTLTPRLRLIQQLDQQIEPLYVSALEAVARSARDCVQGVWLT
jgi:hypothetical protein